MRYKDAGVDLRLAKNIKLDIKKIASQTLNQRVLCGIGSFGAVYDLGHNHILVSSTDSVGTKTLIATLVNEHRSIGEDIVNHCVNDILCQGAEPLFFMDYIASSKIIRDTVIQLVEGISEACKKVEIPLIGGELAEMPDVYQSGEYDLVGFIVGKVDRHILIDGSKIKPGDILIGLPSSGLHTNGYSLVRKVVFELGKLKVNDWVEEIGTTVGEELLKTHRCYHSIVTFLLREIEIHGIVHITGGGFQGNIPRILPEGLRAVVDTKSWNPLPVFRWLKRIGEIDTEEMYNTFNMGVGMILIVSPPYLEPLKDRFTKLNENYYLIGKIIEGRRGVDLVK